MAAQPSPRPIARQAGRSLVEIMIALVIGFVVLGALMLNTAGTGDSGRRQDAAAELETEGRVALNLIATQIRLAGRSPLRVNTSPGAADTNYTGIGLRGCDNGFQSYQYSAAAQITDLACQTTASTAPGAGAAFSVVYEADPLPADAVPPADCTGAKALTTYIPSVTDA
jgi:type IV pilus assembly protein PilW